VHQRGVESYHCCVRRDRWIGVISTVVEAADGCGTKLPNDRAFAAGDARRISSIVETLFRPKRSRLCARLGGRMRGGRRIRRGRNGAMRCAYCALHANRERPGFRCAHPGFCNGPRRVNPFFVINRRHRAQHQRKRSRSALSSSAAALPGSRRRGPCDDAMPRSF
jgi:hypothetical protein